MQSKVALQGREDRVVLQDQGLVNLHRLVPEVRQQFDHQHHLDHLVPVPLVDLGLASLLLLDLLDLVVLVLVNLHRQSHRCRQYHLYRAGRGDQ